MAACVTVYRFPEASTYCNVREPSVPVESPNAGQGEQEEDGETLESQSLVAGPKACHKMGVHLLQHSKNFLCSPACGYNRDHHNAEGKG